MSISTRSSTSLAWWLNGTWQKATSQKSSVSWHCPPTVAGLWVFFGHFSLFLAIHLGSWSGFTCNYQNSPPSDLAINQNSLRLDNKANVIRTTCTHWLYSPTALPYWQCCICYLYLHLRIATNRFIISASSVLLVMNATRTECYTWLIISY